MPPNLQGLNIVHPSLSPSDVDAHDLLAGASFPDLTSQLDLWSNLAFDNDEPVMSNNNSEESQRRGVLEDDDEEEPSRRAAIVHDSHVNVVTGTSVPNSSDSTSHQQHGMHSTPPFDLNAFLAGFGINPFATTTSQQPLPQAQVQQQQQTQPPLAPSLAQLLALHSSTSHGLPTYPTPQPKYDNSTASSPSSPPASKRARTRKSSEATANSVAAESPEDTGDNASTPTVSVAEDKRRRNTAASARFRLKKKEREAALEGRAKELEAKVSELERECEGLRRENGWLKGLVVGVTGAQQGQQQQQVASAGAKRTREDDL